MLNQLFQMMVFVGCLLALGACSGMHGRAEKQLESGLYEEAIATYESILRKDPNDTDAQSGLLKARLKFIDTKLIEVRKTRMGGNAQSASDILLYLLTKQTQWRVFPKGNVAYTQSEEIHEATGYIRGMLTTELNKGFPLSAHFLLNKYKPVLGDGLYSSELRVVNKAGNARCEKLNKRMQPEHPYSIVFAQKFCAHFGSERKIKGANVRYKKLYKGIRVAFEVQGLPGEHRAKIAQSLVDSFRKSAWYHPKGKKELSVRVKGQYSYSHDSKIEPRLHSYTVRIPYTAYEDVEKTREVPYEDREYRCSYDYNQQQDRCRWVTTTRYRTESYTEREPVTRYRSEPRAQSYQGKRHIQKIQLNLQATLALGGARTILNLTDSVDENDFEHSFHMPAMGLFPKQASLTDPGRWMKDQALIFGRKLQARASETWNETYCRPAAGSLSASANRVHQCLRNALESAPHFTQSWYEQNFGVNVSIANELLGLEDI